MYAAIHTDDYAFRTTDNFGRRQFRSVRPVAVFGGWQAMEVSETRTCDGWENEYDQTDDLTVYASEDACWAAIRGDLTVAKAAMFSAGIAA